MGSDSETELLRIALYNARSDHARTAARLVAAESLLLEAEHVLYSAGHYVTAGEITEFLLSADGDTAP